MKNLFFFRLLSIFVFSFMVSRAMAGCPECVLFNLLTEMKLPNSIMAEFKENDSLLKVLLATHDSNQEIFLFIAQFDAKADQDYLDWGFQLDKPKFASQVRSLVRSRSFIELQDSLPKKKTAKSASSRRLSLQSDLQPPPYLFHWTGRSTLELMNKYNPDKTKVPLRFIKSSHFISHSVPELGGVPGLFAWIHPVTGMAISKEEQYFDSTSEETAKLLVMIPKRSARIIEITTKPDSPVQNFSGKLSQYDLVFHRRLFEDGSLDYQEWIILNAEAIESFSANPDNVKDILTAEYKKLNQSSFQYPPETLLSDRFHNKAYWKRQIQDFLARSKKDKIPTALNQRLSVNPTLVEKYLQPSSRKTRMSLPRTCQLIRL